MIKINSETNADTITYKHFSVSDFIDKMIDKRLKFSNLLKNITNKKLKVDNDNIINWWYNQYDNNNFRDNYKRIDWWYNQYDNNSIPIIPKKICLWLYRCEKCECEGLYWHLNITKKTNRTTITKGRPVIYPMLYSSFTPQDYEYHLLYKYYKDYKLRLPFVESNNKYLKIRGYYKIFKVRYERKLSSFEKLVINSFRNKYIYYAIDDLNLILRSKQMKHNELLTMLYSLMTSLQNTKSINFFDIWIDNIYIKEKVQINRFLKVNNMYTTWVTVNICYKSQSPKRKPRILW